MASIFIPRTGTTAISTAIFGGLKGFSAFKFPAVQPSRGLIGIGRLPPVISLPAQRRSPLAPPIKISPSKPRIAKMIFTLPKAGVKAEPTVSTSGVTGIPTVPLQTTSGVIQSSGSGVGRLKSTLSFAFTPEGKLNIPLLALLLAVAGFILKK